MARAKLIIPRERDLLIREIPNHGKSLIYSAQSNAGPSPKVTFPPEAAGRGREMVSHEAACILNVSNEEARLEIWIFYSDHGPVGPYKVSVPAQSTRHVRFNDFTDPEPIPRGTDYSSLIESNVPVVVQHTRLDSQQSENALMTTMAYADAESGQ